MTKPEAAQHFTRATLVRTQGALRALTRGMEKAKVVIFTGLGALVALTIYGAAATKKAGLHDGHSDRLKRIEALMDEGAVKYRPSFFRTSAKKTRHIEEHLAGLEPVKAASETAPVAAKPVDKKAEEAKKAAEKKAADEKKKKEDAAKKKKKKKKKKDGTPEETSANDSQAANNEDKKKDESGTAMGGAGFSGPASALTAVTATTQNPQTADEWIAYLMQNPTFEKFSKFIQLTQTGVVKLQVFYPVIEKVLANDTGRFHEFGTLSLGSVVTSQSFELLSEVANDSVMEDKIKVTARQYMLKYARIEYVRFLGAVATGDDGQAANDAINVIKMSLSNLTTVTVAATPTTSATTRAPAASVTSIYEALQTSLAQAATSAHDGSVKANATNVAQQVASALSGAQSATAASTISSNT